MLTCEKKVERYYNHQERWYWRIVVKSHVRLEGGWLFVGWQLVNIETEHYSRNQHRCCVR